MLRSQIVGLEFVDKRVLELVMSAHMIRVRMCRDCGHVLLEQMPGRVTQTGDAHSCVDHQVAVAAPHMPNIAPHQRHDMRFPEQGYFITDAFEFKPTVGNWQHGRRELAQSNGR